MINMKSLSGATLLAAGVLALSSPAVSARVICNGWGQCWRVHGHYDLGWAWHPGWGWPDHPYPRRWQEEEGGHARAPFWSDDDSCWQVRPIYSVSGAWLDNRRVNVCR
jgi:hypothetical protein